MLSLLGSSRIRLAVVAALGAVVALAILHYKWFGALDLKIYDLGMSVRSGQESESSESKVVVVAIDKYSRQHALPPPEFPISAHVGEHARLVRRLTAAGARIIVFDLLFDQIDPSLDVSPLVEALVEARRVCMASAVEKRTLASRGNGTAIVEEHLVIPEARISPGLYCMGLVNMPVDEDRVVRRSSYGRLFQGEWLPSMPTALASALGCDLGSKAQRDASFYIDYRTVRPGIPTIPYADVLTGEGWQDLVRNRIVMIGVTEYSLGDIFEVPVRDLPGIEHGNKLAGAVILAYATQTLLQGSPITRFPPAASLFLGIVLAVAAAFIALGRKLALDVVLILSLLLGLLALGIALAALRLTILPAGLIVSVTLATAVVGLFVNYLHTRFTAQEQGRELEEISSDLKKAAEIQHSLQPESMPSLEGAQIAGFQVACKEIGGDYYDVIELADGKVGLLLADVCGKGISAALLMSNLQSNFRQMAPRTASPRQLVTDLNAVAARVFSDGRFVTLFYAILDLRTKQFTYSNAGHMPPLICRADGEVVGLELGGLPIGLFPQFLWEDHSTILRSGDVVFVYTDGLSEAAAPKTGEFFGEQRIKDFLRDNHGDSADGLNRGIVKAVRIFSGSEHLDDDITLLSLKVV